MRQQEQVFKRLVGLSLAISQNFKLHQNSFQINTGKFSGKTGESTGKSQEGNSNFENNPRQHKNGKKYSFRTYRTKYYIDHNTPKFLLPPQEFKTRKESQSGARINLN